MFPTAISAISAICEMVGSGGKWAILTPARPPAVNAGETSHPTMVPASRVCE